MHAQIIGLSQQLSLVDGTTSHQIEIVLPGGTSFYALVGDDVAQAITEEFVVSGGEAAARAVQQAQQAETTERQAHPALQQARVDARQEFQQRVEPVEQTRDYAPMELENGQGDPEIGEFGGDFQGGLAAVGAQLKQAEASIASAIADTDPDNPLEMQQAANRLRGIGDLPVPHWTGGTTKKAPPQEMPKVATRRALRITQDDAGNPILKGPGVANHHALLGGSNAEEGDASQL